MHGDLEIGVYLSRLQAQVDALYYCEVLYNVRQSPQESNCYQMQVHMPNIQGGQTITKCQFGAEEGLLQDQAMRPVTCAEKAWNFSSGFSKVF